MEQICAVYRRISLVDLLDLPFNVIHILYKNALQTAITQKEKDEAEAKLKEQQEAAERQRAARERKMQNAPGPIQSAIPVKKNNVQMPSKSSYADARMSDAAMTEMEDLFEEGP